MTDEREQGGDNRLSTADEVEQLEEQFLQDTRRGAPPYVAQPAPGYDVHGLWHTFNAGSRSGYAAHAVALHWTLHEEIGVPTQLIPHRNLDIDIEDFPSDREEMLMRWNREAVGHGHLIFSSFPPHMSSLMSQVGPPLVPYIAYEATTVSKETVDLCNSDAFAKTWVVHPFVKQALVDSGVDEDRIHYAPPMLFGGPWVEMAMAPEERSARLQSEPARPFTFGTLGTWQARKGFESLVRAYWSEFQRGEDVQLVIRTSPFGKMNTIKELSEFLTQELTNIARELGDDEFPEGMHQARVKVLMGTDATDQEIIEWLGSLDCYVAPSYGEGLGIPPIWAKGQGVPMVATDFAALGEMLTSIQEAGGNEDSIVASHLEPVADEMHEMLGLMFGRDSQWGGYDVGHFAEAMRMQFLKGKGRSDTIGAGLMRKRHGTANAAAHVRSGLSELVDIGKFGKR